MSNVISRNAAFFIIRNSQNLEYVEMGFCQRFVSDFVSIVGVFKWTKKTQE